ncbi:hypothetical protein BC830DRAFT_1170263 [Chytriomyces sp. MP71]|nr:hypothetical protein BC830DRAFT_1170263 [Chytriomyces sp. MP71]
MSKVTASTAASLFAAGNEALYGTPESAKRTREYFQGVLHDLGADAAVTVEHLGEARGKGVVARRRFARDDRVFVELAQFAFQSVENRKAARACSRCLRFVGSPSVQIALLLQRSLTASEAASVEAALKSHGQSHEHFAVEIICPDPCEELYCSHQCKDADARDGHSFICASAHRHKAKAITAFKNHAENTNETFLLALKVFAFIAARLHSRPDKGSVEALEYAIWPLRVFVKDYWWNVCMPDEVDKEGGGGSEDLEKALKTLLTESSQLLRAIFADFPEMAPVLTAEFYSLVMGIFERNNLAIVNPNPLLPILEHLPSGLTEAIMQRASEFISSHNSDHEHGHDRESGQHHSHDHHQVDEHGSSDPFEALDALVAEGTGLHIIQGTINHSCTPNCMVFKDAAALDGSSTSNDEAIRDGRTVLRAIKPIQPGDEITISYLDEGEDDDDDVGVEVHDEEKEWRARSLREYGIDDCQCPKCLRM